jgi:hypothetical protein
MHFMMVRFLTLTALCWLPLALGAQGPSPLAVRPLQDLQFGVLIPGVPTVIDPVRLSNSGQLEVVASRGATIELRYTLPKALDHTSSGGRIRVDFDATSGAVSASRSLTDLVRFDPRAPVRFRFVSTDRATFFLGGLVSPTRGQKLGGYRAPIIVTVTNLGL